MRNPTAMEMEPVPEELTYVRFSENRDPEWAEVPITRLGRSSSPGSLDWFLHLRFSDDMRMVFELHSDEPRHDAFQEALVWRDWVAIGWGGTVCLFRPSDSMTVRFTCDGYFGHFYDAGERLLIATAYALISVAPDGSRQWESLDLGIDGVVVTELSQLQIVGEGEWDPPGGWIPFRLHAQTGQRV